MAQRRLLASQVCRSFDAEAQNGRPGATPMRFVDIEAGVEYGLRLKAAAGQPLLHVLVLDKVQRNKQVKVRHLDESSAGMEEFLPFTRIQVTWSERKERARRRPNLAVTIAR